MPRTLPGPPILVLEMNEVPWRVIDYAIGTLRLPNLRRFFERAATYTTHCDDTGELSPWVTWPSLHRGMNNEAHGVRNLGQDVATFRGTPIWEEFRARDLPIGICGSLQSWPPVDPGPGGFFIPDTFAHDERCIPARVEPLQRFNLAQVKANGRVVKRSSRMSDGLALLRGAVAAGVRPQTLVAIAAQVARERLDNTRVARRPMFQTVLFWDVFRALFRPENPPAFSTFFTNHVASAMHRFWAEAFPEDFLNGPSKEARRLETINAAIAFMDCMVGDALTLQSKCPDLILVIASSMGQAAVHNTRKHRELVVRDVGLLARSAGLDVTDYEVRLAMVPQVAISIANEDRRRQLVEWIRSARTGELELFDVDSVNASLSITIRSPGEREIAEGCFRAGGRMIRWSDAGIEAISTDPGTAYHIPEGVLAIRGASVSPSDSRCDLPLSEVKGLLAKLANIAPATPKPGRERST